MRERKGECVRENESVRERRCVPRCPQAPKPAQYVKEMHDQSLFYGNRVIKEYKGKDE